MKILVVDDHVLFVEAIRPLLRRLGAEEILEAHSGREGLDVVRREHPEVVLLDLDLPDMHGVAVGRRILDELPDTKVVGVSADDRAVSPDVLRAGFAGLLTKHATTARFIRSLRSVLEGKVVHLTSNGARQSGPGGNGGAGLLASQLTPRELDVLEILVQGGSNASIAARLSLSPNTVRTHVQSILTKLQVRSRLEAAAFAVRHGIVTGGRKHA